MACMLEAHRVSVVASVSSEEVAEGTEACSNNESLAVAGTNYKSMGLWADGTIDGDSMAVLEASVARLGAWGDKQMVLCSKGLYIVACCQLR